MKQRLLFLVNPHAGKSEIRSKTLDVADLFVRGGWEVTLHPTQRTMEIPAVIMEEAKNYQMIVCCGGDGTLNETVSGLLAAGAAPDERPPLGYIPAGTVNDFATSLGISKNIMQAARTIVSGAPFICDVGSFNDRFFTYIAAFGAFTDVSYQTPQQSKNLLGRAAYILEGIKRLPGITAYHLIIRREDVRIEDDFIFGMVTNSTSVGGFRTGDRFAVSMNDGILEAVFIRNPRSVAEMHKLINAVLRQELDSPFIVKMRAKELHVSAACQLPWTLDGEYGGAVTEAEIRVCPGAIQVLTDGQRSGVN